MKPVSSILNNKGTQNKTTETMYAIVCQYWTDVLVAQRNVTECFALLSHMLSVFYEWMYKLELKHASNSWFLKKKKIKSY